MRRPSILTALTGALVVGLALSVVPAQAYNENPQPNDIPDSIPTHFYDVAVTQVPTVTGAPYVTALNGSSVLSIGWDYQVALTDVISQVSTPLGSLGVPDGSRIVDFQYFPEWPATATSAPVYVSYSVLDSTTDCYHLVMKAAQIDLTGSGANSLGRTWFTSP